jgi:hypothetical protein
MAFMETHRDVVCGALEAGVVFTPLRTAGSNSASSIHHPALAVRLDINATNGATGSFVIYRDYQSMTCLVPVERTFLNIAH